MELNRELLTFYLGLFCDQRNVACCPLDDMYGLMNSVRPNVVYPKGHFWINMIILFIDDFIQLKNRPYPHI